MRYLADENIPLVAVRQLRDSGVDISSVTETGGGASDRNVLAAAVSEGRIVVTFDRHFGELLHRQGAAGPEGIVLLRINPRSAEYVGQVLARVLTSNLPLTGHFTVVAEGRVRSVPLKR